MVLSASVVAQLNDVAPRLENGIAMYDEAPDSFGENIKKIKSVGVDIVGGCCGTTPEHIKVMANILR